MKLREIMISDVKSCSPDTALDSVALTMWSNDCGAVPIIDAEGRPIGIVTDRDIAMGCAIQHRPLWEMRSGDITQSRKLYTCAVDDDVASALELMKRNRVRRVPVVDRQGKLAGILSLGDVVACSGKPAHNNKPADISGDSALDTVKSVVRHH